MELDFRFGEGTVDSGVHVRTQDQIQIGISGSLKRDMTCSPYIPGKGYPVEAKNIKNLLKSRDWNTMRIRAIGNQYTVWLQDEEVMTYKSRFGKGRRSHRHPVARQSYHGNRLPQHEGRRAPLNDSRSAPGSMTWIRADRIMEDDIVD